MGFHVGIFLPHLPKDLVPEDHGIIKGIALADAGEAAVFLFGQFIGIAHDALCSKAGEDSVLNDRFPRRARIEPSPGTSVLSFAVFPDKDHVNIFFRNSHQRARRPLKEFDRAQVDILIKIVTDAQEKVTEGNMIRNTGIAHRTQIDGIKMAQRLDAVIRHHLSRL